MIAESCSSASLTTAGCSKASALVRFCDAFEIPVITLTNAAGFAANEAEENTVASAAAGLAAAFAGATVPKINVITKRAAGSAYAVMNSKALGADLTFAYTDASVGILAGKFAAPVLCSGSSEEIAEAIMAGILLGGSGLVLSLVMLFVSGSFGNLTPEAMVWRALWCLVWEAVIALAVNAAICILAAMTFDKKGEFRKKK